MTETGRYSHNKKSIKGCRTVIKVILDRIRKIRKDIGRVLRNQSVTARGLARIAGQCVSMSKCVICIDFLKPGYRGEMFCIGIIVQVMT